MIFPNDISHFPWLSTVLNSAESNQFTEQILNMDNAELNFANPRKFAKSFGFVNQNVN